MLWRLQVETPHNPFRYCGEYYDDETDLIYLRNRYYDNQTGRFITEDPIKDGLNWYSYCGNNPVMFVDPWGLEGNTQILPTLEYQHDDVNVYLRDMFNMHKKSSSDSIDVYNNRVDVNLNGKSQTYYYDTKKHDSIDGNYMEGNKMVVNSVEFAERFGLVESSETKGNKAYLFAVGEYDSSLSMVTPLSASAKWNFVVRYVKTPNNTVIIGQTFYLEVETWTDRAFEQPTISPTKFVKYTSGASYTKTLPLFEFNGPRLTVIKQNTYVYDYVSCQRKIITKSKTVAEVAFSIMAKSGIGWYNEKIKVVLP